MDHDVINQPAPSTRLESVSPTPCALPLAVYATNDKLVVLAPVSGMKPEDVEILVDQATLTLVTHHADIVNIEGVQDATWYLNELEGGEHRRSVALPFEIETEGVEASIDQGVLRIELPKSERSRPRRIPVNGGSAHRVPELEQFPAVARLGNAVYSAEGLRLFLTTPAERFDGRTALDLLRNGEEGRVVSALASDYEAAS